jgi:hypothetical protein
MPEYIEIAIAWAIVIATLGGAVSIVTFARAKFRATAQPGQGDSEELASLRDTVHRLSGEVADLHERVDFTERLLAKQRDVERLKGGQ